MYIYCGLEYLSFKEAEMILTGSYVAVLAWWILIGLIIKLLSLKKEITNMDAYNRMFGFLIFAVGVFIIVMERIG